VKGIRHATAPAPSPDSVSVSVSVSVVVSVVVSSANSSTEEQVSTSAWGFESLVAEVRLHVDWLGFTLTYG